MISKTLRESAPLALAALPAGESRVDRARKIIRGVKMLGWSSPNTHGVEGVEGTDYERAAVERARPMYEGLPAYANHPPRDRANQERDTRDALGIYHNVRVTDDGMFGDLHLVPAHELTESILDVAERDDLAGVYAVSHNADGDGKVVGKRYRITEIVHARSCDVVTRGATTKTLFESQEGKPMRKKLSQAVLESRLPAKTKAVLLELDAMDAEYDDSEAADAWKDHLVSAVGALVKSDDEGAHKTAKKVLALLEPEKAEELEESDDEEDKARDTDSEDKKGEAKGDKEQEKKAMEESRELFALAGVKPSTRLLESVARMPRLADRIAFVNELKGMTPAGKGGNKPPPGAPRGTPVLESQGPKYDDLLATPLI